MQKGEITVDNLSLSPFKQFPAISLRVDGASLSENSNGDSLSNFIEIDRLYVSFDILKLLNGDVNVSKITLVGGHVDLNIDDKGLFNILRATSVTTVDSLPVKDYIQQNVDQFTLDLRDIDIENIDFSFIDERSGFSIEIKIDDLSANVSHANQQTDILTKIDFELLSLGLNDQSFLKNKKLSLSTGFSYGDDARQIQITNGRIKYKKLDFNLNGSYDLSDHGNIDLKIDGSDNGLNLLSLIIEDDILSMNRDLVDQGNLYFNGSVKGKTIDGFPNIKFDFGADGIKINLPDGQTPVEAFSFIGLMETGDKADFSLATLQINELKATLLDGELEGKLEITNFVNPSIKIISNGQINLGDFTQIFKIEELDSLSGNLVFKIDMETTINQNPDSIPKYQGVIFLKLKDVAIKSQHFEPLIHSMNGTIENSDSTIELRNISLYLNSSDISINGDMTNFGKHLIFNSGFTSQLNIESNHLSISDFIPDESQLISNLNTSISIKVPNTKVSGRTVTAVIDDFRADPVGFPEIQELTGQISYNEGTNQSQLIVKNIHLKSPEGLVDFTGTLAFDSMGTQVNLRELKINSPEGDLAIEGNAQLDSTKIKFNASLQTKNISVREFIQKFSPEKVHTDSLKVSSLNASLLLQGDLVISDSLSGTFTIQQSNISYTDPVLDTIELQNINLEIKSFSYRLSDTFNATNLQTLQGNVNFGKVRTAYFNESGVGLSMGKDQSKITLNLISTNSTFGNDDIGTLIVDITENIPKYDLTYRLNDVRLEPYLNSDEDTIINGSINFNFQINTEGNELDQIVRNAKGQVLVTGNDINLYGFNLDEILANYKKSQNFRLTDVGAFMLMGPFGPLVTKGNDFVKLSKIDPDDTTIIREFYSKWEISDQILKTRDVAFTTERSRIAFDGSINLNDLTIPGFTVAVVDKKGCSLMDQTITGSFSDPEFGKLNVVGTLFGAVINVFKVVAGNQCEPVYTGIVGHPQKK